MFSTPITSKPLPNAPLSKVFTLLALLIVASLTLASCSPPPPLRSDKYFQDKSLISQAPCGPPCFQNIIVGETTYSDAEAKLKANPLFSNVQQQDANGRAPLLTFNTKLGEPIGQVTGNDKGFVEALLVKLAPGTTAGQLIEKYGDPQYVTGVDYSQQEVALALIFPKVGLVAWVTPGDASATLKPSDPVVIALYLAPNSFPKLIDTATLQGWNQYLPYKTYKDATPIVTPKYTATPQ